MIRSIPMLACLLAMAGCSSRGGPAPPEPPPDTGLITIEMNAHWEVTDIVRIDTSGEPLPFADPNAPPFLSIQMGQVLSIWQGQAWDWFANEPLYQNFSPGIPNRRYLNAADGRFWLFDFQFEHQPDCYIFCEIRAAFGTVDENTLDGIVQVTYLSDCPEPLVIRPNPNGTYRVKLGRMLSSPAAAPLVADRPPAEEAAARDEHR